MSSYLPFPLADFYDALVSNSLKEKLQPFIAQFKKKNIYIVFQCVNRLIQIITNKSQVPIMKFNALMATRLFFDTCQYPAIIFIEVYLLPIIYQIALEKYLKRSQEGVQMYFIDRGAENTKQMKRLGLNYVELAAQFIFNSAKVKPFRLIQNKELKQQSNFSKVVKILKSKNILEPQKCIYYIPSYQTQTRKKYLKKLKHLAPEPYISFVITQYLQEINLNKKCDLDLKKLLLFGDAYITSTMINIIQTQLDDMSHNFINKKKFVSILNDMIRSGDIEAIILLNSSQFIAQITSNIQKVRGDISQNQGEFIYPKIQASKQQKKQFYLQFLRCLQIWAYSLPTLQDGEQSDAKIAFDNLKQKNFIFPQNVILKKIKIQMEESLKVNQERNQVLMKIIQQDDNKSVRNNGSYMSDKEQFKFKFSKPESGQQYLQLEELQNKVFQAKKRIARLGLKQQQLDSNMKQLKSFKQNWNKLLDKLDIQDEDGHQLQILLQEGDLCCEQIKILDGIYIQYNSKKLSKDQFIQKIQLFLNSEDGEDTHSRKSKNKTTKKFENSNKTSEANISIENDINSQKRQKDDVENDISVDSKQSLISKNKERLNKAKGIGDKKQNKPSEQKIIKQIVTKQQSSQKLQRFPKNLQKKETLQQQKSKDKNIQKEFVKSNQQKKSSSKMTSQKYSGETFNQNKNLKVQFQPCQIQLNKTSSKSSFQLITQKSKQKKISIIKHSVISKSSHKSQPTEQKIYFTGQQSHSLINQHQFQKNQVNLKKSLMKRTQRSKGKIKTKTSKEDDQSNSSNKFYQKQQKQSDQLKSPFKKKSSVLKSSILKRKENIFDTYQKYNQDESDQGYQKVFRTKNRSKIKFNSSKISSESEQEKDSHKIIQFNKNRREERLQYYNEDLSPQCLNSNNFKNLKRSQFSYNSNQDLDNKKSNKTVQAANQYVTNTSQKIIKFNQKISEISKQTSRYQQKSRQSGVKLFSKNQEKSLDKMYNKQGNFFSSDYKNGSSVLDNESYVEQYKIKSGTKMNSKQSSKENFLRQQKKKKNKIFIEAKQPKDLDLIKQPDNFPLLNSYYSQKQFEGYQSKIHEYSDFRSCYDKIKNQVLPINESQSKVVSKSFSMDKISNFIQYKQRSSKMSTMVDAISQKNAKNSILMYKLQRQKTRLIQNLQNKIKSLQSNGKFMRTKLAVKDQLKNQQSMSIKQLSERQNFKIDNSKNIKSEDQCQSSISLSKKIQQKNKLNSYSKKEQDQNQVHSEVNNLKCQLLNINNYTTYFPQNSNKKSFFKKKGVLLKTQQIQIGFMVNKKQKTVNILLFLTPLSKCLIRVQLSLQNDQNLFGTISPTKLDRINLKKQQIINCKLNIKDVPFKIPSLTLKYFSQNQNKQKNLVIQLPCSVMSFCQFSQKSDKDLFNQQAIRSDMFKVNKKIFKPQKLNQILPNFKLIKEKKKNIQFQGKITYNGYEFEIRLIQNNLGLMCIQGYLKKENQKMSLQFLVCTLRYILLN